jgi:hypothetical protein
MVMKPDLSTLVDLLNIVVGERERTFSDQELCNEKKDLILKIFGDHSVHKISSPKNHKVNEKISG